MQKDLLDGALEDISIIKNSIGENKNPYIKLYQFLLLVGIINLIYYVATTIGVITLDIQLFSMYVIITLSLKAIMYILLLIYFIRIYKEEIKNLNKYYLSFLIIVAGIILFLPLLVRLTRMFIFIDPNVSGGSLWQLQVISMTTNILLFCFSVILSGFILRKQSMVLISAAIFFIFLIISTYYSDVMYTFGFSKGGSIYLLSTYYSLIVSIGYIIIATVLKNKCKVESANGNI